MRSGKGWEAKGISEFWQIVPKARPEPTLDFTPFHLSPLSTLRSGKPSDSCEISTTTSMKESITTPPASTVVSYWSLWFAIFSSYSSLVDTVGVVLIRIINQYKLKLKLEIHVQARLWTYIFCYLQWHINIKYSQILISLSALARHFGSEYKYQKSSILLALVTFSIN